MRRPASSLSVKRRSRSEAAALASSSRANSYPKGEGLGAGSFSTLWRSHPRHPEAGVADLIERGQVLGVLPDSIQSLHPLAPDQGVSEHLAEPVLLELDVQAGQAEHGGLTGRAVVPA